MADIDTFTGSLPKLWTVTVHVFSNGMTQRLSIRPAPVQEVNQLEYASYV